MLSPLLGGAAVLGGDGGEGMAGPRLLFIGACACLIERAETVRVVAAMRDMVRGRIVVIVIL